MTDCPQQHEPNQDMTQTTNLDSILIPEVLVPELVVPEQPTSQHSASDLTINNQSPTTNTQTNPATYINDQTSSSNLAIQPVAPAKTNVPSPPTLFLHSTILANVCEGIFQELNHLVQARNNLIHKDSYEKMWTRLKDRVEFVLLELQRSCFDAQEFAQAQLQEWLKGVVSKLHDVKILRTWVKTPLCLEAESVIPSSIHPRELNLDWLTKLNLKEASSEMALLQRNTLLEKENHQLKKELLEQKLMLLEYKTTSKAQLEEARIRKEKLIKSNEDFKKEMKQEMNQRKQLMEMMLQKTSPALVVHPSLLCYHLFIFICWF